MYKPRCQITGIQRGRNVQGERAKKPGKNQPGGESARGRTSQGANEPKGKQARGRISQWANEPGGERARGRTSQGADQQRGEQARHRRQGTDTSEKTEAWQCI